MGSFGVEDAFAPLPAMLHPQMVGCMGAAKLKPYADEKGNISVKPLMTITYTFDCRYYDASVNATYFRIMRRGIEDPATFNIDDFEELPPYGKAKT